MRKKKDQEQEQKKEEEEYKVEETGPVQISLQISSILLGRLERAKCCQQHGLDNLQLNI